MKKLNLNSIVKVKLSDYGKDIFYHQFDDYNKGILARGGRPMTPHFPEVDNDGYSRFQLWYFMQMYGDHFKLGMDPTPLEDLSIYIDEKDLDEVEI